MHALTLRPVHWLVLALFAVTIAYAQGLPGIFLHDDFSNIVANDAMRAESVADIDVGAVSAFQPTRSLAMVSFAVNYALGGENPAWFKLTNILLHLLCGIALFVLLRQFFRRVDPGVRVPPDGLAAVMAAIWLAHPLNVSTVLYVVQRMTILATLFVLLALVAWLHFRDAPRRRWPFLVVTVGCVALGLASKETAVLAIPLVLLFEAVLRRPSPRQLAIAVALLALAGMVLLWLARGSILHSYGMRDFTLVERLMTEARIVVFYLSELLVPLPQRMSLFLEDFAISRSLLEPASTLPAVLALLALLAAALVMFIRHRSLVAFGVLFFFIGHLLESTVWGLELAYEHRNYLAGIGIVFAVTLLAARLLTPHIAAWAAGGVMLVLLALLTVRTHAWSSLEGMAMDLAEARPGSARAQLLIAGHWRAQWEDAADDPARAALYVGKAREHLLLATTLDPRMVTSLRALLALPGTPAEHAAWWAMLRDRVGHGQVYMDTVRGTLVMPVCLMLDACDFPAAEVDAVLDGLLANPGLRGAFRARVMHVAGAFKVQELRDAAKGLPLSEEAARIGPPHYRVTHLANLVIAGRREEAAALYRQLQDDRRLTATEQARVRAVMAASGRGGIPVTAAWENISR